VTKLLHAKLDSDIPNEKLAAHGQSKGELRSEGRTLEPSLLTTKLEEVRERFRPETRRRGINRNWNSYKFLLRDLAPFLQPGKEYVDLGAGAGVIPLVLASCGLRVTVMDTWSEYAAENDNLMGDSAEMTARFDRAGIEWIRWNLLSEPLPLTANCCDLLTAFDVLEHIPTPRGLLKEMHRLLRPGGLLVIKVPNTANLRNRLRLLFGKSPHPDAIEAWFSDSFFGHFREMTASEFRRGLPLFNFEVESIRYTSASQWNTRTPDGFESRFRVNSLHQLAKFVYFGATALVPAFRYEILVKARKIDR
jgi:2-polyprenyl-3-methyl-5-hydroxy-6-metoxy-1,4-benzoquinol methylase